MGWREEKDGPGSGLLTWFLSQLSSSLPRGLQLLGEDKVEGAGSWGWGQGGSHSPKQVGTRIRRKPKSVLQNLDRSNPPSLLFP